MRFTSRLRRLLLAFSLATAAAASAALAVPAAEPMAISVYFPDYRVRAGAELALHGTTHLVLFSSKPTEEGGVDFARITPGLLEVGRQARAAGVKVTVCVGGWGRGKLFANAVSTPERRARFADTLATFCAQHDLDGVDVDWEFPRGEREHADFERFLAELSGRLRPAGRLLTVALGYTRPLSEASYAHIDQVNLMCYHPWNPPKGTQREWLEGAVERMLASGLPPEKLLLGVGFYAKEMGGKRRAISYKNLVGEGARTLPESEAGFSGVGRAACDLRLDLVREHGLGGVMVWDYGHDSPDPEHSLLKYLSDRARPEAEPGAPDHGYRGVWYMNQPSGDEYRYKYSGGMATYCAKHNPFAVYRPEVDKTFFCYGGAKRGDDRALLHMVSYFDHATGTVPRPFVLLDKKTTDAHDNPVLSVDDKGHLWVFSTSHGTARPSFIHRSTRPYDIGSFERVEVTFAEGGERKPWDNFSYMQAWHLGPGRGFACFFTRYGQPAKRSICFMASPDGVRWGEVRTLAAIEEGHYQISAAGRERVGSTFNFHPAGKGLNWRTNLYYIESSDGGETWTTAAGEAVELPLTKPQSPALIHDYGAEGLNVYVKDIAFDADDRPVILYLTSKGYQAGPDNGPRQWRTARWTGEQWEIRDAMRSDSNYDMGSLWIEPSGGWRVIAPTDTGPQPFNPGGEVADWRSADRGASWDKGGALTAGSAMNHGYVRRPVGAHRDFYALWADGHGRQPSPSSLYFADANGRVFRLPRHMEGEAAEPEPVQP